MRANTPSGFYPKAHLSAEDLIRRPGRAFIDLAPEGSAEALARIEMQKGYAKGAEFAPETPKHYYMHTSTPETPERPPVSQPDPRNTMQDALRQDDDPFVSQEPGIDFVKGRFNDALGEPRGGEYEGVTIRNPHPVGFPPGHTPSESHTPSPEAQLLLDAMKVIGGERVDQYGNAEDSFATIAAYWQAHLQAAHGDPNVIVTPKDVAMMMIQLKLAREAHSPKYDNRVDIAGYAGLTERIVSRS